MLRNIATLFLMILFSCTSPDEDNLSEQGFVVIPETHFEWKGDTFCLNEFEISDHTVTNLEYRKFVNIF